MLEWIFVQKSKPDLYFSYRLNWKVLSWKLLSSTQLMVIRNNHDIIIIAVLCFLIWFDSISCRYRFDLTNYTMMLLHIWRALSLTLNTSYGIRYEFSVEFFQGSFESFVGRQGLDMRRAIEVLPPAERYGDLHLVGYTCTEAQLLGRTSPAVTGVQPQS